VSQSGTEIVPRPRDALIATAMVSRRSPEDVLGPYF
jgi:hypothetical protein